MINPETKEQILLKGQELQSVLDGFDFSIFLIDSVFNIRRLNKFALSETRQKTFKDAIGKKCYQQFFNNDDICNNCQVAKSGKSLEQLYHDSFQSTQVIVLDAEVDEVEPLPRLRHMAQRQYIVKSRDKEFLLVEVLRDVSEEKERRDEVIRNEKLIALGTVVQTVAHELGNPLTGISLGLQSIEKGNLSDSDMARRIHLMKRDLQLASHIVQDIQQYLKKEKYDRFPVVLLNLIKESYDRAIRESKIAIQHRVNWQPFESLKIQGSENRLIQVFLNLFKNSIDAFHSSKTGENFMPTIWLRGSIISKKTLKTSETKREFIEIQIIDNAGGIPDYAISRVFDPYYTTKRLNKGSGLGLFLVNKIVEEHEGIIEVESRGRYTRFILNFPVIKD